MKKTPQEIAAAVAAQITAKIQANSILRAEVNIQNTKVSFFFLHRIISHFVMFC